MLRKQDIPTLSIEYKTNFRNKQKTAHTAQAAHPSSHTLQASPLPRTTRLLALAHHLRDLLNQSIVRDYADIARLSGLSRARLTQIMNLMLLAPQIQEEILLGTPFISRLNEQVLRVVLKIPVWEEQLKIWEKLTAGVRLER
jgi:preprotein translocase subunit Sec63